MDGFDPNGVNVNEKDNGPESETDNSENMYNNHGSGSDGLRYLEFNADMDMEKPKFVKGLVFPNMTILKEAIKQNEMVDKVEVKLKKNYKQRLQTAARATYLREFEDDIDQLNVLSEVVYNWIKGNDTSQWFRPTHAGLQKYQVEVRPPHHHVVNLEQRSCPCRK
ncbi:hypothetical protein V6N13_096402 [Hibiscus sabdariffa]